MNHHYSSSYMSQKVSRWICSPRYSIASNIRHNTDLDMHYLPNLDRSSHQTGMDHLNQRQNNPHDSRFPCHVPMKTVETMESNQNHSLLCYHTHDQSIALLLKHWISHTLPQLSSIQEEAHSPFHCPQPRWTRRTCNNMWALIAHGAQCRLSPLFGCTQYSGSIVVGCPVLSPAHSIRIRGSIGSGEHEWNQSCRSL